MQLIQNATKTTMTTKTTMYNVQLYNENDSIFYSWGYNKLQQRDGSSFFLLTFYLFHHFSFIFIFYLFAIYSLNKLFEKISCPRNIPFSTIHFQQKQETKKVKFIFQRDRNHTNNRPISCNTVLNLKTAYLQLKI